MASQHRFIDHTADIAVELIADSFEELIIEALISFNEAVFNTMDICNNEKVEEINLTESDREKLLVSFLNEINFILTVKKWASKCIYDISIITKDDIFNLFGKLKVCNLNADIELKEEIKSVTYHQMEIKEESGKLFTRIVFDI